MIFKDHLLQAPESSISICTGQAQTARSTSWMIKELLTKLKREMDVYKRWKQGQIGLGKPKSTWNSSHQGLSKAVRKVFIGTSAEK